MCKLDSNMGTTRWMAPELMGVGSVSSGGEVPLKYPFKSDIYSFGMVCYEILTGCVPFPSMVSQGEVKQAVLRGDRPPLPKDCPWKLRTLIKTCWSSEAESRPSFGDICEELRDLKYEHSTRGCIALLRGMRPKDIVSLDELLSKFFSPVLDLQKEGASGICQMVQSDFRCAQYISEQEVMALLVLRYYGSVHSRGAATAVLQALCDRRAPGPHHYLVSAVRPIVQLLECGGIKARENAVQALLNLLHDADIDKLLKESSIVVFGCVPALVWLLQHGSNRRRRFTAVLLLKTLKFSDRFAATARLIEAGFVPTLMKFMTKEYEAWIRGWLDTYNDLARHPQGLVAIAEVGPAALLTKMMASEFRDSKQIASEIWLRLCMLDRRFIEEAKACNVS